MAGFVSVPNSRGAGLVARPLSGGWVWARRALPAGASWSPAPSCVFVPFDTSYTASCFARDLAARGLGRVWVRSGLTGSPVFSACRLRPPVWCVKVEIPNGWRCAIFCIFLRSFQPICPAPVRLSAVAWAL